MAEPIDLPFGLWTRVEGSPRSIIRQMAPMCPSMWGHWRHLATTIEPSVCGGDAVLMSSYFDHLFFFVCASNISGTDEWICLVHRSDAFECQGQSKLRTRYLMHKQKSHSPKSSKNRTLLACGNNESRSPRTKMRLALPSPPGSIRVVYAGCKQRASAADGTTTSLPGVISAACVRCKFGKNIFSSSFSLSLTFVDFYIPVCKTQYGPLSDLFDTLYLLLLTFGMHYVRFVIGAIEMPMMIVVQ